MPVAKRMDQIPFSSIRKVFEEVLRREKIGEEIIHLEVGRPDFDTPNHIKEACKDALDRGQVHYTSNYGLPELRKAVAEKLLHENQIKYDPETELIITSGVTEAIFMGMMALLNPGDEVLVPTPCFPAYRTAIHMAGAKPVEVPLNEADGFRPDVIEMQSRITSRARMLIVNTPCNPTGAVYERPVLEALAKMAIQNDLLVMSDEIYEKMVYNGAEHISIASLPEMASRTLTLNGFSKNYSMTGWRIGYVAAPTDMIGAMLRIRQYVTVCPTTFAKWGAVEMLLSNMDGAARTTRFMVSNDCPNNLLHIKRAITRDENGKIMIGRTKNKYSRRKIKLLPMMRNALEEQKKIHDKIKGDFFFSSPTGAMVDTSHLRKRVWRPALKHAGLDYREMKQTRHSFAPML